MLVMISCLSASEISKQENQIPLWVKVKYFIDKHVYFIPIFLCVHNICTFISGLALEEVSRIGLRPLFFER